jgi:hypothetical protein
VSETPPAERDAEWDRWWAAVDQRLAPMTATGWLQWEDETWGESGDDGPVLGGTLRRGCSALEFEFEFEPHRTQVMISHTRTKTRMSTS